MGHDFKKFPELTNRQMQVYYFESPHKQITEDFRARVIQVTDGDTIRVKWRDRDFTFPIRFSNLAAPELNEQGGIASLNWLAGEILGKDVDVKVDKNNRVEKWGRLLGEVWCNGFNMAEESIRRGHAVSWRDRANVPFLNFFAELEAIE